MLLSATQGVDPESWAPFAFGGFAVAWGAVFAVFPTELDAVIAYELQGYGVEYRGGFPVRGAGIFFMLVGGFTIMQALTR
jgi:hypothetical protein